MKLKKGLRLSNQTREQIAQAVIKQRMGVELDQLARKERALALDIVDTFVEVNCPNALPLSSIPEGYLPTISAVQVPFADAIVELQLEEETPVPYLLYTARATVLKNTKDNLLITAVEDFLAEREAFLAKKHTAESKIFEYLCSFKNPYALIEKSPEFASALPEEFFDDSTEQVSIDELMAA